MGAAVFAHVARSGRLDAALTVDERSLNVTLGNFRFFEFVKD